MKAWDGYFGGAGVPLPPEAIAVVICREFGWTWDEYQQQPWPFIQAIVDMMVAESRAKARQQRKS